MDLLEFHLNWYVLAYFPWGQSSFLRVSSPKQLGNTTQPVVSSKTRLLLLYFLQLKCSELLQQRSHLGFCRTSHFLQPISSKSDLFIPLAYFPFKGPWHFAVTFLEMPLFSLAFSHCFHFQALYHCGFPLSHITCGVKTDSSLFNKNMVNIKTEGEYV